MSRNKSTCEYKRVMAKQRFDKVRGAMIENGRWLAPHRTKWLLSQEVGSRVNQHIVDPTHVLAHRSYIAGFLEGNTSATRPWFRSGTDDHELNLYPANHDWLDRFTRRCLQVLSSGNYYNAAAIFYGDFGCFNTGSHYIDETPNGLFFHTLEPGTYYVLNDGFGRAVEMIREFSLTVKALVDYYGVKDPITGKVRWNNFSPYVKRMYDDSNYTQVIDICHQIYMNEDFDPQMPVGGNNRQWVSKTYELGSNKVAEYSAEMSPGAASSPGDESGEKYLKIAYSKRQPFIVGKSDSSQNFEYGETGPMTNSLGLVKSLNKKAISKDQALEQIVKPAMQGPANLRKSYITTQANSYVPLDPMSVAKGQGLRPVFEVNPAIQFLVEDVGDLRRLVDKMFYADFLLYLSQNPKTRTATETDAIVKEQQLVIGPNLQSLNWTYNVPVVEFVMDYVLYDDPWILDNPVPESLAGKNVKPTFISVFAQAQRAADLPAIRQYIAAVTELGQLNPKVFDKANVDKIMDIYEDRLFLPAGINNPQDQVDAMRAQAEQQAMRAQMLNETVPALAGAAKDVGLKVANQ